MHPGWVATDLGGAKAAILTAKIKSCSQTFSLLSILFLFCCKGAKAALSVDRGAEAPLYAALLPPKTKVTQIAKKLQVEEVEEKSRTGV